MTEFGPGIAIDETAYVHPSAQLYGAVAIGPGASVWPNVVMRAEAFEIRIGACSNIQDFVMVHIGWETPTLVGAYCSITHHVTLHGCTIGDNCLIGINATVMDGAIIGDNCIVAGHAIVSEGMVVPDNSIVAGVPAKVVKTRNNLVGNRVNALLYHRNAQAFARGDHRAWSGPAFEAFLAEARAAAEAALQEDGASGPA